MKPNNYILGIRNIRGCHLGGCAVPPRPRKSTARPVRPSATITVDGNYLPPPPPKFGGVINMDVKNSKP